MQIMQIFIKKYHL